MNLDELDFEALIQAATKDGPSAAAALGRLRQIADSSSSERDKVLLAWRAAASREPMPAQLWMLFAAIQNKSGDRLSAIRSWHQASKSRGAIASDLLLASLGVASEQDWRQWVSLFRDTRATYIRDAYADIRHAVGARDLFRIDRALAGYLGEATVFSPHPTQRPKVMYVPGLRGQLGFLDPASHELVQPLLDQSTAIREEFDQAMMAGVGIEPFLGPMTEQQAEGYVAGPAGAAWNAIFFYRHGERFEDSHIRFPRTSAALDALNLCRIDGQAPEILFSILQPQTRIQPHHGVTNARVVIHIPLQIPSGCYLELTGIGRRYWQEGQAVVFDDSFEHAAENPSTQVRGILLMDAWHPDLSDAECRAFRAIIEAITRIESLELN